MIFDTYNIRANADTKGLDSYLSPILHLDYLCMGAAMSLVNLHICTDSMSPSCCHNAINTKIKCANSFDLFFALNEAKLKILQIQRDDNHRNCHEGCNMSI